MRAAHAITILAVLSNAQAISLSKLQRRASKRNRQYGREPAQSSFGCNSGKGCMTQFVQLPADTPWHPFRPAYYPTRTVTVDITTYTTTTIASCEKESLLQSTNSISRHTLSGISGVGASQAQHATVISSHFGNMASGSSISSGFFEPLPSSNDTRPGLATDTTEMIADAGSTKTSPATTTSANGSATSAISISRGSQQAEAASAGIHKAKGLTSVDILAAASVADRVGWTKNWASTRGGVPMSLPFIPMLWNDSPDRLSSWRGNVDASLAESNSLKVLFTFNEPEPQMCEHKQACMTVANAVATWKMYVEPYYGTAVLVSPSVCSQEAWGKPWLDEFLASAEREGLHVDAIGLHWYGEDTQISVFQDYLTRMYLHFNNRPIWLTEFGVTGSMSQQAAFYKEAVSWLNQQSFIAGYAAFLFGDDPIYALTDGEGEINEAGQAYINA